MADVEQVLPIRDVVLPLLSFDLLDGTVVVVVGDEVSGRHIELPDTGLRIHRAVRAKHGRVISDEYSTLGVCQRGRDVDDH